jgi:hypothetical protein
MIQIYTAVLHNTMIELLIEGVLLCHIGTGPV